MSKLKLVLKACYKRRYIRPVAKKFVEDIIKRTLRIYTTRIRLYSPIIWEDTNSLDCEQSSNSYVDFESDSDSDYVIFDMNDL